MIIQPTPLSGLFTIELVSNFDSRGSFTRIYCRDTFLRHDLEAPCEQWSVSRNDRAGTLRGLHYQAAPYAEIKLIRCTAGEVFDVVVDLREGSPTLGQFFSITLTVERPLMLYVPKGFAHGFLTLADRSELTYAISPAYQTDAARGICWNDPTFAIPWPSSPSILSDRDAGLPAWAPGMFAA